MRLPAGRHVYIMIHRSAVRTRRFVLGSDSLGDAFSSLMFMVRVCCHEHAGFVLLKIYVWTLQVIALRGLFCCQLASVLGMCSRGLAMQHITDRREHLSISHHIIPNR